MLKDISNYIKYRIDRMLNKGLFYQLMLLVFAIIILLLIVSIFIIVFFQYPPKDAFWDSLMQFIDTGNISSVEGNTGIVITFLMVTFVGVCGWGSLIAMINKALQDRINNLSKGNAFIMEKNHAIILGYGEEALTIIEEFIKAKVKTIVILSEHNVDVIRKRVSFIKVPLFIQDIKQSMYDNEYRQDMIGHLRFSEVLVLDDIGSEAITPWTRDEILFPILDYRMNHELKTYFTSNYTLEELEQHYCLRDKENGYVASLRLMERIKALSTPVSLLGKSRR